MLLNKTEPAKDFLLLAGPDTHPFTNIHHLAFMQQQQQQQQQQQGEQHSRSHNIQHSAQMLLNSAGASCKLVENCPRMAENIENFQGHHVWQHQMLYIVAYIHGSDIITIMTSKERRHCHNLFSPLLLMHHQHLKMCRCYQHRCCCCCCPSRPAGCGVLHQHLHYHHHSVTAEHYQNIQGQQHHSHCCCPVVLLACHCGHCCCLCWYHCLKTRWSYCEVGQAAGGFPLLLLPLLVAQPMILVVQPMLLLLLTTTMMMVEVHCRRYTGT
jgi:hypothetical protein